MEKTKTKVGKLFLDHCLMNASGVKCRTTVDLRNLYRGKVKTGAVVCKSCTLDFRRGNQGTIYYHSEADRMSINSSGLHNYGYNFYLKTGEELADLYKSRKYQKRSFRGHP